MTRLHRQSIFLHKVVFALLLIFLWCPVTAQAFVYDVNRTFGISNATLTGTVTAVPGNYVIQNSGASPFTNVNLSLTVNGTSYNLVNVDTHAILGTGQFLINAGPSILTFATANSNATNPADLAFSDVGGNLYSIGSDTDPRFEIAITNAGDVLGHPTFPVLFGIAVPANGDFYNDGFIDARDYVFWRKYNGPATSYAAWRANYANGVNDCGICSPVGSGSSIESASVPEPSTLLLFAIGAISLLGYRKQKSHG